MRRLVFLLDIDVAAHYALAMSVAANARLIFCDISARFAADIALIFDPTTAELVPAIYHR
jgi:hypothetical protein